MAAGDTTYEQTLGLMTAITEITRNSNKSANALKTIGQRIRGVGEDGEDASEYVASLQENFDKLGINVQIVKNSAGEMESTYNILKGMAEKWNLLTDAERQSLGELAAGKNRITEFNALMSNWQTAVEATATAMNSQGSAAKENERVLESIEGHINQLKSAWQELSTTMVDSDIIKMVVDLGTAILKLANSDIAQLIIKSTALFAVLKAGQAGISTFVANWSKIKTIISGLKNPLTTASNGFKALKNATALASLQSKIESQTLKETKIQMEALGVSTAGVTTKKKAQIAVNNALASSQLALNIAMAAFSIIVTGAITLYQKQKQKQEELLEERKKLIDSAISERDSNISVINTLEELSEKYDELYGKNGVGNNQETLDLQEKINSALEGLGITVDIINSSYQTQHEKLQTVIEDLKKANNLEQQRAKIAAEEEIKRLETEQSKKKNTKGLKSAFERGGSTGDEYGRYLEGDINEKIRILEETQEKLVGFYNNGLLNDKEKSAIADELDAVGTILDELKEARDNYKTLANQIFENMLDNSIESELKDLGSKGLLTPEKIEELRKSYKSFDDAIKSSGIDISEILTKYNDYDTVLKNIKEEFKDNKAILGYIDAIEKGQTVLVSPDTVEEVENAFAKYGTTLRKASDETDESANKATYIAKKFSEVYDKLSELENGYKSVIDIAKEYNNEGILTIDSLETLIENWDTYGQYVDIVNGKMTVSKSKYVALANAQLDEAEALAYNNATTQLKAIADQKVSTEQSKVKTSLEKATDAYYEQNAAIAANNLLTESQKQDAKNVNDTLSKQLALIKKARSSLGKTSSSSSSSKSTKSWWEKQLDTLKEQYSNSEITIEEYIKALEKLLGKLKKGSDAWKEVNKLLQEQKLSKVESDYKRGVISLDEYIKKLQELIKTYKQGTKAWQDLADKIKEGLLDKAEQEQKDYEDAAKAATSIIDDEIKRLEELKDAKQKANDETEKELELAKLQEALEKARNERTKRVFVEGKGWTYVQDEQAIKEAQEALDEFNKEQETDEIDKQIEALEKYKEAWSNVSSDYEKEQQKLLLAQQFGADAEEQILNKRLEILEEYRKRYLETLKQISDIEKKTAEEILGATTGTSTGTGGGSGASGQAGLVSSIKAVFGQGRKNSKSDVKALQQALMALGYSLPKYGADGKWGSETLKALKKFQKDNGLKTDGIVGKNTKSAFAKKGYANGGVVDYTGYAMVHGSANYPEVMLNNRQAAKLYSMLSHPAYNRVGNTSNTTQVYNFDKLVLPNVKNANQFLSELKALVNITKNN